MPFVKEQIGYLILKNSNHATTNNSLFSNVYNLKRYVVLHIKMLKSNKIYR